VRHSISPCNHAAQGLSFERSTLRPGPAHPGLTRAGMPIYHRGGPLDFLAGSEWHCAAGAGRGAAQGGAPQRDTMKILIVDSDRRLVDSIDCRFREAHCEVHYASDGAAGLQAALQNEFDLIVLDWTLPEKDGLGVLKKLRRQQNWTPVLMLTAEDAITDVVLSLDSGANSCVAVPFEFPVLLARMKALVRRNSWGCAPEQGQAAP
jgi:CheY-like chemotaxis protein